jgi:putative oxidoreductase
MLQLPPTAIWPTSCMCRLNDAIDPSCRVECLSNPKPNRMSNLSAFLDGLHGWVWLGILLARVSVGLEFFLSGRGKLFVNERRKQMLETLRAARVPLPEFNALFVSTVEFTCGLLLIAGALTPLACLMLGCVMIVALATTVLRTIKASSLLEWLSYFFYLPEVLYLVILVWLFLSGPGWFSVDHFLLSGAQF